VLADSAGSAFDGRSILVTGAAGFIGSHLVDQLAEHDCHLVAVDRRDRDPSRLGARTDRIEPVRMDIAGHEFQRFLADRQFELVFHLAGNAYVPPSVEDPRADFLVNLDATFRMADTLRRRSGSTKLVFTSSAAVYGNPARLPMHEQEPTVPTSPYGVSKLAAERYLAVFSELYGLRCASLRLFSSYGPRQQKQIVFDFMVKLRDNPDELMILGDGSQTRDFVFVTDVVAAALLVAERGPAQGETYNVASGTAHTTRELAAVVAEALDLKPEFRLSGQVRPGDTQHWRADISRLSALGYTPQVPLPEGVRRTACWFQSAGAGW
jgi:UDP-glucose 4-epimerase